jgi:hypothetical protein
LAPQEPTPEENEMMKFWELAILKAGKDLRNRHAAATSELIAIYTGFSRCKVASSLGNCLSDCVIKADHMRDRHKHPLEGPTLYELSSLGRIYAGMTPNEAQAASRTCCTAYDYVPPKTHHGY